MTLVDLAQACLDCDPSTLVCYVPRAGQPGDALVSASWPDGSQISVAFASEEEARRAARALRDLYACRRLAEGHPLEEAT